MATAPGFASGTNTFVPSFDASGRLIVGYSRNPKKFNVPKYVQYVESPKDTGYFLKLGVQEAARVVNVQDFAWPDGNMRPMNADGLEQFNFVPFLTQRYNYGFTIGWKAAKQADWALVEQHSAIHCAQLMTARTVRWASVLTTTTNWTQAGVTTEFDMGADHTATAATLAGGYLNQGTSTTPFLKIALDKIAVLINKETLGVVEAKDLMVLSNPNTSRLVAESSEIHEYIKGSPAAIDEIRTATSPNSRYGPGLPSQVYGYEWITENAVKVTSRKYSAANYTAPTKSFAFPDQTIVVVARPGALEGVYGAPSFSTATMFWYNDELTLEKFDDPENRLTRAHCVEDCIEILTSPLSGYLITSATSVAS